MRAAEDWAVAQGIALPEPTFVSIRGIVLGTAREADAMSGEISSWMDTPRCDKASTSIAPA